MSSKEEICEEDCDCHSDDTIQVGNNVYTNTEGGAGMSEEMKELIKRKQEKTTQTRDNKIIQFKPKMECLQTQNMCPADWATPYTPTWEELKLTLKSLDDCYDDATRQLATAGVQSEFSLRERLHDLEQMRALLMDYFKPD
jgi:hypothetical protein